MGPSGATLPGWNTWWRRFRPQLLNCGTRQNSSELLVPRSKYRLISGACVVTGAGRPTTALSRVLKGRGGTLCCRGLLGPPSAEASALVCAGELSFTLRTHPKLHKAPYPYRNPSPLPLSERGANAVTATCRPFQRRCVKREKQRPGLCRGQEELIRPD